MTCGLRRRLTVRQMTGWHLSRTAAGEMVDTLVRSESSQRLVSSLTVTARRRGRAVRR